MDDRTLPARVTRAAAALACAAVIGLLLLAAATTVDVLLRYGLARPIRGFIDVAALSAAVLIAACLPYALATRAHISVDALGARLGGRARRVLDVFAALLTTAFFAVMAWQYVRFAVELDETGQVIAVLRWPVWPWWSAVAALVVVSALVGAVTAWQAPPAQDAAR